jgi:hypothetical protein
MHDARHHGLALLICLLGCASGTKPATPRVPMAREGRFEFVANLPRGEVRGMLTVLPDTMYVEPENGFCQVSMGAPDQRSLRYDCPGLGHADSLYLRLDRRNPRAFSRWFASTKVQRTRQVCVRFTTNSQGQRSCAEYRLETYEEKVRQSGVLRVQTVMGRN